MQILARASEQPLYTASMVAAFQCASPSAQARLSLSQFCVESEG